MRSRLNSVTFMAFRDHWDTFGSNYHAAKSATWPERGIFFSLDRIGWRERISTSFWYNIWVFSYDCGLWKLTEKKILLAKTFFFFFFIFGCFLEFCHNGIWQISPAFLHIFIKAQVPWSKSTQFSPFLLPTLIQLISWLTAPPEWTWVC